MNIETSKCTKCKQVKSKDLFYKDTSMRKGHKSACIDCTKEIFKTKYRPPVQRTTCIKCDKAKIKISFRDGSTTCKVCERKEADKKPAIRKEHKPTGAINAFSTEQSMKADAKTKCESHNRNVREIQKKGYIKSAEVQQITKIIKPDLYSADIKLNVDNRIISYQIGEFKTEFELEKGIEAVYQNPINVAQQYLGVVS